MRPLVFVHGLKGATLIDGAGRRHWLRRRAALGLGDDSLALPLTWGADGQGRDGLRPEAPLRAVTLVPGLLGEQVYGPWLAAAARLGGPLSCFVYDWRRDCHEALAALSKHIARLRAAHGGAPVRLVGHSLGGLLAFAHLSAHPASVHDAVLAGCPFAGGIGFLTDMHVGTAVGRNRRLLSPAVLATFASVYGLFPLDGHGLVERDGGPVAADFFDPDDWARLGLGTWAAAGAGPAAGLGAFLRAALPRARDFRRLLVAGPRPYPPLLVVSGRSRPTLVTLVRDGPRAVRGWDFAAAPTVPGDGRVSQAASLPPAGVPYRLVLSRRPHAQLLNDPAVIRAIAAAGEAGAAGEAPATPCPAAPPVG